LVQARSLGGRVPEAVQALRELPDPVYRRLDLRVDRRELLDDAELAVDASRSGIFISIFST
jgi:hypothetical protein